MALFDVSGFKPYSELRGQILPAGQTHLVDRTNHYAFGTKTQEFAVPLGVDVSIVSVWLQSFSKSCHTQDASDAERFKLFYASVVFIEWRVFDVKCYIMHLSELSRVTVKEYYVMIDILLSCCLAHTHKELLHIMRPTKVLL